MLLSRGVQAQQPAFVQEESTPFYKQYLLQAAEAKGASKQTARLATDASFTAVALSLPNERAFAGLYCVVAGDSLPLQPAVHQPENGGGVISELLVFDVPQSSLSLYGALPEGEILLHVINASTTKKTVKNLMPGQGKRNWHLPARNRRWYHNRSGGQDCLSQTIAGLLTRWNI